ncbi:DUF177 domain-containing protein [Xanthocytophaga agilis]|uniref:DUF177 domain-containing protein n=1 Tax=Xanthocytophaga agilis TaxID=3048010 RepID=A0AAE3R290_9BACT|nr:DUF177 domain-containing protein [Xanthocytophaga agilis]MDJ1502409.1 DUF177 domain-containing protein [Xanthocytophaga agilis]
MFLNQKYIFTFAVLIFGGCPVKDLKDFDIDIIGLKDKAYTFDFKGNNSFFKLFENSLVENGVFKVELYLDKSATMIQLNFHITGSIELTCDRSLEQFDYPLDIEEKHILKFGEDDKELTDEIEIINRHTATINVAQYIYEFIVLAIPMKKIHPKFADQQYEENEEGLLVYRSKEEEETSEEKDEENIDPRWAALRKLNNN